MKGKKLQQQSHQAKPLAQTIFVSALLVLTTLCVFWPVSRNDFVNYDDDSYVTANQHVEHGLTGEDVKWAFSTSETGNWHPLTWLSLMLDAQLFGKNASGFHLTNLFLHVASTIILFLVFKQLTGALWRSALIAALFAVHPLHVESVAWIAERKDVLSAFFFMLTLWAYACYAQKPNEGGRSLNFYCLTLLFFLLGLMSKPMLVTLPFVLMLLDYWPLQRFDFNLQKSGQPCSRLKMFHPLFREKIPFFILSAISCVVTFFAQSKEAAVQTLAAFPINVRIENAFVSYARYLEKTILPIHLAIPYPYSDHWPMTGILFAAVLMAGASWLSLKLARKFPFFFVGWFWFVGMLLPVIGLVQVGAQSMADRYSYLPLIGIFIILTWEVNQLSLHWRLPKTTAGLAIILVLAACAVQTRKQIGHWQNSGTLFRNSIAVTENNAIAYEHLGYYYTQTGQTDDEMDCYRKAVQIAPESLSGRINLGSALLLAGNLNDAAEQFNEALRLAPDNAAADCDLGYIFAVRGNFNQAIAYYYKAIQSKPDFVSAYHDLGLAFAAKGEWDKAIQNYIEALRLDPQHASVYDDLGTALSKEGKRKQAIQEYQEALRLNPNDSTAAQTLQALEQNAN
jgi:protein O-mannosyl-transferase